MMKINPDRADRRENVSYTWLTVHRLLARMTSLPRRILEKKKKKNLITAPRRLIRRLCVVLSIVSPDRAPDHCGVRTLTSATATSGFCAPNGVDTDRSPSCLRNLLDCSVASVPAVAGRVLWNLKQRRVDGGYYDLLTYSSPDPTINHDFVDDKGSAKPLMFWIPRLNHNTRWDPERLDGSRTTVVKHFITPISYGKQILRVIFIIYS